MDVKGDRKPEYSGPTKPVLWLIIYRRNRDCFQGQDRLLHWRKTMDYNYPSTLINGVLPAGMKTTHHRNMLVHA